MHGDVCSWNISLNCLFVCIEYKSEQAQFQLEFWVTNTLHPGTEFYTCLCRKNTCPHHDSHLGQWQDPNTFTLGLSLHLHPKTSRFGFPSPTNLFCKNLPSNMAWYSCCHSHPHRKISFWTPITPCYHDLTWSAEAMMPPPVPPSALTISSSTTTSECVIM